MVAMEATYVRNRMNITSWVLKFTLNMPQSLESYYLSFARTNLNRALIQSTTLGSRRSFYIHDSTPCSWLPLMASLP